MLTMLLLLNWKNTYSQVDSSNYNSLIKHYNVTEIVYDDCINSFWTNTSTLGLVYADSIIILDPVKTIDLPLLVQQIKRSVESNQYPQIVLRAGYSGHFLLDLEIGSNGKILKDSIIWNDGTPVFGEVKKFIDNVNYGSLPASIKDNKVKVRMMLSLILKRKKNPEIENIAVWKSNCMLECPSYTITLNKDGSVLYEGNSSTNKPGKWIAQTDKSQFNAVLSILYKMNFFKMEDKYYIDVSDLGGTSVTVKTDSTSKRISTNYYSPLWAITYIVERITNQLEWKKVED